MKGGRRPKDPNAITGNRSKQELEERKKLQPNYPFKEFKTPKELTKEERKKWRELVKIIKSTENSPNTDADKDAMINYCKAWARFIEADEAYQIHPADKENYKKLMDNAKLLSKLKSDLMLDPVSRIKTGNTLFAGGAKSKRNEDDDYFD